MAQALTQASMPDAPPEASGFVRREPRCRDDVHMIDLYEENR
jgi:hypothetical protein